MTKENLHTLNTNEFAAKKTSTTNFNILVCGSSGIGKSSFADLFMKKFNFAEAKQILKSENDESLKSENIKGSTVQNYNHSPIRAATDEFVEKSISSDKKYG